MQQFVVECYSDYCSAFRYLILFYFSFLFVLISFYEVGLVIHIILKMSDTARKFRAVATFLVVDLQTVSFVSTFIFSCICHVVTRLGLTVTA